MSPLKMTPQKTCRAAAALALLALIASGCGSSKESAREPVFIPHDGPARAQPFPAKLPKPLLRLPMITLEGAESLALTWDAEAGTPPLWLHWRTGRESARARRVRGLPVPGASRLRYRVQIKSPSPGPALSYRICLQKNCTRKNAIYSNAIAPSDKEGFSFLVLGGIGRGSKEQIQIARLAHNISKGKAEGLAPSGSRMTVFMGNLFPAGASIAQRDAHFFHIYGQLMASGPVVAVPGPRDLPPDCGASFLKRFGNKERFGSLKRGAGLLLLVDSNRAGDYAASATGRRGASESACAKRCPAGGGGPLCAVSDLRLRDQKQTAWLVRTLLSDTSGWRIAFMYHPLFSVGFREGYGSYAGRRSAKALQRRLYRLFRAHKVDVVISSGDPIYERSLQIQDTDDKDQTFHVLGGEVDTDKRRVVFEKGRGPIFVVTGGAGAAQRKPAVDLPGIRNLFRADRIDTTKPWVGVASLEPHAVHVRIEKDRLILGAWGPGGRFLDQIAIEKPDDN